MYLRHQLNLGTPQPASAASNHRLVPILSTHSEFYLVGLGMQDEPEVLFLHAIAILYSPQYRRQNSDALRLDWPRIPLPMTREALNSSVRLGRRLFELVDAEAPVRGIHQGPVRTELATIATISREGGGRLDPEAGDLTVTARWGYRGQAGAIMPGPGRTIERDFSSSERSALEAWSNPLGLTLDDDFAPLGRTTYDIYLNDRAYWRNVPAAVWS
jgi:hypothetical protein